MANCSNVLFSATGKAKDSCNTLFMEIISEVIFAASTKNEPPEHELVAELIETVISTKQLSHFSNSKTDKIPLVRSHLLQLLLDYEYVSHICW